MSTPTSTELTAWVHRGVALFCLGALVPAAFMAADQIQQLAWWWLLVFGLGIVGLTLVMTALSILRRPLVVPARIYLVLVAGSVVTWPLGALPPSTQRSSALSESQVALKTELTAWP